MDHLDARRCAVLLGLAAGDRNGGPQRLAVRMLEAVAMHPQQPYPRDSVAAAYLSWYSPPPQVHDRAFDTGAAFDAVFHKVSARGIAFLDVAVQEVHERLDSAGVGAAHRAVALSLVPWWDDEQLCAAARSEATITHLHCDAVETAVASAVICRKLMGGSSLQEAVAAAQLAVGIRSPLLAEVLQRFPQHDEGTLHRGGHAPLVLEAALHFVGSASSFESALAASLKFAQLPNYCPVLVGPFAGALFGAGGDCGLQLPYCRHRLLNFQLLRRHLACLQSLGITVPTCLSTDPARDE